MANFYMMVGLPGSGKTTFVHNIEKGAIVISSDIIRKELWGSEEKQGDNKIVFEELEKREYEVIDYPKKINDTIEIEYKYAYESFYKNLSRQQMSQENTKTFLFAQIFLNQSS